jgi:Ca2+-binding RTX toxin-like protein
MASIPGSYYDVFARNQAVNFGVTADPNNVPAPVAGDFNLEVVSNTGGNGSFTTASAYQGLAILSTDGHTLTLLHGTYGVVDAGGNNNIFAGDGNVSIGGALGDTITGGTGGSQFLDVHRGDQSVVGGSAGNETIFSGIGDTIIGGAGNVTIGGVAGDTITGGTGNYFIDADLGNQSITGGSAGNGTIWGGAGDTITGGGGNVTIGGGAGDTITGGSGDAFIDGHLGNQSIVGGSAGNETIWGGGGDTIQGGSGGNETIAGVSGNTITGGAANTFIDATMGNESIVAGSGNSTIWGGAGDTIQGASGSGSALIGFAGGNQTLWDNASTSTGSDSIFGFSQSSGDRISLNGVTDDAASVVASATADSSGNAVVQLSDGSSITLLGVSPGSLNTGFFTSH